MVCVYFDDLWEFQNEKSSAALPDELAMAEDALSRCVPVLAPQIAGHDAVHVLPAGDTLQEEGLMEVHRDHMNLALDFHQ